MRTELQAKTEWAGQVAVFTGRYWTERPVRVRGSRFTVAAQRAAQSALGWLGKGARVSAITIRLSRVKPVQGEGDGP